MSDEGSGYSAKHLIAGGVLAVLVVVGLVAYTVASKSGDDDAEVASSSPTSIDFTEAPGYQEGLRCYDEVVYPVFDMLKAMAAGRSTDSVFVPFVATVGSESVELEIFTSVTNEASAQLFNQRLEDILEAADRAVADRCVEAYARAAISPTTTRATTTTVRPSDEPEAPLTNQEQHDASTAEDSATVEGCPESSDELATAEQAARCLYEAWRTDRRTLARVYAYEPAVEAMFEVEPSGPEWTFEGCDTESTSPVCRWFIPDDFHGVMVEMIGHPLEPMIEYVEFYG